MSGQITQSQFASNLKRYYSFYTGGFVAFVILVGILEQMGVPNKILGYIFLFATIMLYAGIGFMSKTADVGEYYVAGRRVPALFNGMATGADWMSAASFIGMAGTLYLSGYDGLAFVLGWTGGYCLVAILLAPYLRKFGQFTIPDFLGARFGGHLPRFIGVVAAIICSFTYVIAQIYGVGIITSRFTGLEFQVGVFVGLAGILVCSFLGGMKAVTWTQVAQYIILIVAYMIPVVWLSVKHTGVPIPQISAYTSALPKVTALEKEFNDKATPKGAKEESVRAIFRDRAAAATAKLAGLEKDGPAFLAAEKQKLTDKLAALKAEAAPDAKAIEAAEKAVKDFPADAAAAKKAWTAEKGVGARAAPVKAHAEAFAVGGKTPEEIEKNRGIAKKNFLALIACLMIGTAALPHILMRYYTTPSVHEARVSVFWGCSSSSCSTSPHRRWRSWPSTRCTATWWGQASRTSSLGQQLVHGGQDADEHRRHQQGRHRAAGGNRHRRRPDRAGNPGNRGPALRDLGPGGGRRPGRGAVHRRRPAADHRQRDVARPVLQDDRPERLDGSPSGGVQGPVARGGAVAAYVTSLKPGDILFLVGAAFSLAASGFFPALVCGVFWKRANYLGAVLGMSLGLGTAPTTCTRPIPFFGVNAPKWWDINPISAGTFGIPAGFLGIIIGSLISPAPSKEIQELVDHVRYPSLEGDIDTKGA
jgi:cation/acetate symporter